MTSYSTGDRIGALRNTARGTTLDYTGRVVTVDHRDPGYDSLVVEFTDGQTARVLAHPDSVVSMTRPVALARLFLESRPGDFAPDPAEFVAVIEAAGQVADFYEVKRALWVLAYDQDAHR
jgi:hypothetical protein